MSSIENGKDYIKTIVGNNEVYLDKDKIKIKGNAVIENVEDIPENERVTDEEFSKALEDTFEELDKELEDEWERIKNEPDSEELKEFKKLKTQEERIKFYEERLKNNN